MPLDAYRKKRNFTLTPEPPGQKAQSEGHSFVVQKHAARRLHYDLRLEWDGVLKSWAVTRGPSLVPGEKRLAVRVEDHPLDYGTFEGTIPEGEYGAGAVILWDRGQWKPLGDAGEGFAKGHLDFELMGEKLRGRWHLVRMARKPRDKHENWLLIKGDDAAARKPDEPDILEEQPKSVKSRRRIEELEGKNPGWSAKTGRISRGGVGALEAARLKGAKKVSLPDFVPLELASLTQKAPSGSRWIHEIKFDGYRLEARIETGKVKLLTRTGLDWTGQFGERIIEALRNLPVEAALIDGELVVENAAGVADFPALQADLSQGRTDRFLFYAFDLLYLDGYDLRAMPLTARKVALAELFAGAPSALRISEDFDEDGEIVRRHVCRLGLEGIVSKLADSPYRSGRGKDWRKSKCTKRQEFVICGYVPSTTERKAVGSLVLGVFEGGDLVHVGRAGTGFTLAIAEDLQRRLEPLRIAKSPYARRLPAASGRDVRFVEPRLVAEIAFSGWTSDGILRHASFKGLREDKPAADVVREDKGKAMTRTASPSVTLTHSDRLYWPQDGVTKQGLADYYTKAWAHIAPFIVERPLALLRCPEGISGECFFQKHAWKGLSPNIRLFDDPKDDEGGPLLMIEDLDGLLALAQAGVLEIHPWGSSARAIEHPDVIIFDLDPGPGVGFDRLIEAALEVRERLEAAKLAGFVKTSGGKGLHVEAPLEPKADWSAVKAFAKALADEMAKDDPDRFVATIAKTKRKGKILVDYLRNGRGATAVAPYSTRARSGAPVSMPLAWEELGSIAGSAYFTLANAPVRLAHLSGDPWAAFREAAVPLPKWKRGRAA
jgi:bifunctional non-homologous end joining protein LigD